MKQLILIRGLPGSGKSTLAQLILAPGGEWCEADHAFTVGTKAFDKLNAQLVSVIRRTTDPVAKGKPKSALRLRKEALSTGQDGEYIFDPSLLTMAHSLCLERATEMMEEGRDRVVVAGTLSQPWEAEPYFKAANEFGYSPFVVECQNHFGSVHNVPTKTIDAMRSRWLPLT